MAILVPCLRSTAAVDDLNGDTRSADMLRAAAVEIERLRNSLENLEVQAIRDVVDGWVCIPAVEWDSIMTPNVK